MCYLCKTRFIRILYLLSGFGFVYSSISCHDSNGAKSVPSTIEAGKLLAHQYCQSCHIFPEPSLIDKSTWTNSVLPNMGPRLGVFSFAGMAYPSRKSDPHITANFYPDHPLLSSQEWQEILSYYAASAPDSLSRQDRDPLPISNHPIFKVIRPKKQYSNPVSTYITVDSLAPPSRRILLSDGQLQMIYAYNETLIPTDSVRVNNMIVDMVKEKDKLILCNIGQINPNDAKLGKIQEIGLNPMKFTKNAVRSIFDSLRRPVQILNVDLNGDQQKDILVCEFGNLLGALSWLENKGNGKFEKHILREVPGAIHAIVQDVNHDGLPDIWVLFAQGDEGIVLFVNKGKGRFDQQQILRFPPIYGSTSFDLVDFNGDGYMDILYTCGDNADFSPVLKPYHGVYLFLNDGQQHFQQKYFYPIHGCYKAIARDFDGDGDLDIAAISFFADYSIDPGEGFVYLENKGNWNFEASTLQETKTGRWLTMDAGDVDGDGKPDIVLGNFSVGPTIIKTYYDWKNGPPFLLLKNISKSRK
ncbi:MAG: FG-GAP repeat domain-containing protein [Chitinophagales bacterium]